MTTRDRAYFEAGAKAFQDLLILAYDLNGRRALHKLPRDQWPATWEAIEAARVALYQAAWTAYQEMTGVTLSSDPNTYQPLIEMLRKSADEYERDGHRASANRMRTAADDFVRLFGIEAAP
jgi:hypothetical protein